MHDISPEALRLVEHDAVDFIVAVQHAKKSTLQGQVPTQIILTLDAFFDNPMLLYACLWYGASQGVTCVFVPAK